MSYFLSKKKICCFVLKCKNNNKKDKINSICK